MKTAIDGASQRHVITTSVCSGNVRYQ